MKKLLIVFAVLFGMLTVASCSSGSSPKDTVAAALKASQAKDYKALVGMLGDKNGNALDAQQQEAFVSLLNTKAPQMPGIVSYEVISEEIAEDGNSAVVTFTITEEGKEPKQDTQEVLKGEDGKWRLSTKK